MGAHQEQQVEPPKIERDPTSHQIASNSHTILRSPTFHHKTPCLEESAQWNTHSPRDRGSSQAHTIHQTAFTVLDNCSMTPWILIR